MAATQAEPIDDLDLPIKLIFIAANSGAIENLPCAIRGVSRLFRDGYDVTNTRLRIEFENVSSKASKAGMLSSFLITSGGVRPAVLGFPVTREVDTSSNADRKRKRAHVQSLALDERLALTQAARKRRLVQLKESRRMQLKLIKRNKNVTSVKMNVELALQWPRAITALNTMKTSLEKLTELDISLTTSRDSDKVVEMSKAIVALSTLKKLSLDVAWSHIVNSSYDDSVMDTLLHPDALPCLEVLRLRLRTRSRNRARALKNRGLRAEVAGKLKELAIIDWGEEKREKRMGKAIQAFVALEKLTLSTYIEIPQTLVNLKHVSVSLNNSSKAAAARARDAFVTSIASRTQGLLSLKAFDLSGGDTSNYDGWDLQSLQELELAHCSLKIVAKISASTSNNLTKLTLSGPMKEEDAATATATTDIIIAFPPSVRSLSLRGLSASFNRSILANVKELLANVKELAIDNVTDETLALLRNAAKDNVSISALRLSGSAAPDRLLGFLASLRAPPGTMRSLDLEGCCVDLGNAGFCAKLASIITTRMSKLETLRLVEQQGRQPELHGRISRIGLNGESLAALFGTGAPPSTLRRVHLLPCTWVRGEKGMQALASALKSMPHLVELRVV